MTALMGASGAGKTTLLDVLANRLVESKYDLKAVLEFIATSQAYQSRAEVLSRDAEDKGYVYRGPRAKRLTAEQFVDAIWRLTGTTPAKIELKVPRVTPDATVKKKPVVEPLLAAAIWSGAQPTVHATGCRRI